METKRIQGTLTVLFIVLVLAYAAFALAQSYEGPLIETHAHIVHYQSELGQLKYRVDAIGTGTNGTTAAEYVSNMDRNNIACTLGFHGIALDSKQEELRSHAQSLLDLYSGRFTLFAEIFRNNPLTWFDATSLDPILATRLYSGLGEIQFENAPLDDDATPEKDVLPNDSRFLAIYSLLGDRGLIVMAHPSTRDGLQEAVSYDPDGDGTPNVTWIIHGPQVHGRWDTTDADGDGIRDELKELETLLDNNPNLYYTVDFFESLSDLIALKQAGSATAFLDYMNANYSDLLQQMVDTWKDVIERHPDRFMWGTDMANHSWQWDSSPEGLDMEVLDMIATFTRDFIGQLSSPAAENFAYKNALRVIKWNRQLDQDDVSFHFKDAHYSASEGDGTAIITVEKLGGNPETVSVDFATSDGTAVADTDYTATNGTLAFAPGDPGIKTFEVTLSNNNVVDGDRTVILTLSRPTNPRGTDWLACPSRAMLTIRDNDVEFRFKDASYRASESGGTATINVEKLGGSPETVSVDFATGGGTAIAGTDYVATSGTLTFDPGDPGVKTFSVPLLCSNSPDGNRTVNLTLSNPAASGPRVTPWLGSPSSVVLTIDNDVNTCAGTSVITSPVDSTTGTTPVTVEFASVSQSGITSLTTSNSGATPPSGFQLGTPPTYYEITTTAVYSSPVTVCINFSGITFDDPTNPRLYHLEGGVWIDRTVSLNPPEICASVSSFSSFAIFEPIPIPVAIDIKPGSFPNSINLGSGGTVPVAIFSTQTFDARTLNPSTITLASAPVKLKGQGTPMASFQDVNGDGLLDIVVHVSTEALQLSETDTAAVLRGKTLDGRVVKGTDSIRVVP